MTWKVCTDHPSQVCAGVVPVGASRTVVTHPGGSTMTQTFCHDILGCGMEYPPGLTSWLHILSHDSHALLFGRHTSRKDTITHSSSIMYKESGLTPRMPPTPSIGLAWYGQRAMLWQGHAPKPHDQTKGLGKDENKAPEPRLQNGETQRHGGPKRPKHGPKTEPSRGRKRGV